MRINNWNGLQAFGINPLTGEACKYSQRLLCDLNEDGVALLTEFFGLRVGDNPQTLFADNWNSTVSDKPAVASIMLARDMFDSLCKFALFHARACTFAVKQKDGSWIGYDDEAILTYTITERTFTLRDIDVYRNPTRPSDSASSRNQHAFTGRTT